MIDGIEIVEAYTNLKRAIRKRKINSPGTFYLAYGFLETFPYTNEDLGEIELMVKYEIESVPEQTEEWRNLHDIIHAIRAQKNYVWEDDSY